MGLTKLIFNTILGWKIKGNFDSIVNKAVVIVAPHTSWHDFYIGAFTRKILDVEINYVAKKELFSGPFGWYFKWMGGTPLDRMEGQKKVETISNLFAEKDVFRLALSPEGTRKRVEKWKTGFYFIALKANVPVICVSFDYKTKTVTIAPPYYLTQNMEADFEVFHSFFENVEGKIPENFTHNFI